MQRGVFGWGACCAAEVRKAARHFFIGSLVDSESSQHNCSRKLHRILLCGLVLISAVALSSLPSWGQTTATGTITGLVTDNTNACAGSLEYLRAK